MHELGQVELCLIQLPTLDEHFVLQVEASLLLPRETTLIEFLLVLEVLKLLHLLEDLEVLILELALQGHDHEIFLIEGLLGLTLE